MIKNYRHFMFLFIILGLFSIAVIGYAAGGYSLDGHVTTLPQFLENTDITAIDQPGVEVINGGTLFIKKSTIQETGTVSITAGVVMSESGSTIMLENVEIDNDATAATGASWFVGVNGIYSTGDGSMINLKNVNIDCSSVSSRGLYADAGTITAENVNIVTNKSGGGAAIATSPNGGTIIVQGGSFTSYGANGSAGVLSVGNVTINNSRIIANAAEAAVVESGGSINLNNTYLEGSGISIYTAGDILNPDAYAIFRMKGGVLTDNRDWDEDGMPMFYCPNVLKAVIMLDGVKVNPASRILINTTYQNTFAGKSPVQGSSVEFNAKNEILKGDIICDPRIDSTSGNTYYQKVIITLENHTILTGAINPNDGDGATVALSLDKSSLWNVTADSYLTTLIADKNKLFNIHCPKGITVYYNLEGNEWLNGKEYRLPGGGILSPF